MTNRFYKACALSHLSCLALGVLLITTLAHGSIEPAIDTSAAIPAAFIDITPNASTWAYADEFFWRLSKGYCGGDPVNNSDPSGLDYITSDTSGTGQHGARFHRSGDAVYYVVEDGTSSDWSRNVLRKVRIGTWSGENIQLDSAYGGGNISMAGAQSAAERGDSNTAIKSGSDSAINDQLSISGAESHESGYLAASKAATGVEVEQSLMEKAPVLRDLREGSGIWNGVKLFAYSFENTVTLNAFKNQDMTWSAYGYRAVSFNEAVDTVSGDVTRAGIGVFTSLAPSSSSVLTGSFRLAEAPLAPLQTGLPVLGNVSVTREAYQEAWAQLAVKERVGEIQAQLGRSASFGETYGVGVVRLPADSNVHVVISHASRYGLPRVTLQDGELLIARKIFPRFHAEKEIILWSGQADAELLSTGATRPVCPSCTRALQSMDVPIATPIK